MKIAKLVSKQVKKRDAITTAVRKKSYSAAPAKAKFLTPTTGKKRASIRNARVKEFMDPITKGKNKNFVKDANKKTLPGASKSSRASIKEASFNSRMQKHPLVRNAGESSAEGKYRLNRGKPIAKKRGK